MAGKAKTVSEFLRGLAPERRAELPRLPPPAREVHRDAVAALDVGRGYLRSCRVDDLPREATRALPGDVAREIAASGS